VVAFLGSIYSGRINTEAQDRRRLEHGLRRALENQELMLYYQTAVDVWRRILIGAESFIRWDSTDVGFISPGRFIPIAEDSGLIEPIGEWIIVCACTQARLWHARGIDDIRINVNGSVGQLCDEDFTAKLPEMLVETGCDPHRLALGLEITESESMENVQDAIDSITRFREMGLAVYIDDFGTGYCSLAHLRRLPIDTLKVDASFVRDIPGYAEAVAVVKGIIAMAHGLELRGVSEEVETEAQFAALRAHDCDAVQGGLFGRPGPPEDIEPLYGRTL